jgi:hypothetical protein
MAHKARRPSPGKRTRCRCSVICALAATRQAVRRERPASPESPCRPSLGLRPR